MEVGLCSASVPSCLLPLPCYSRPFSRSFPCSQSYLQAASDGPAGHGLDPSANYNSPKFRSRNQSYMRAVSMLSQASCVSQVGTPRHPSSPRPPSLKLCCRQGFPTRVTAPHFPMSRGRPGEDQSGAFLRCRCPHIYDCDAYIDLFRVRKDRPADHLSPLLLS